MNNNFLNGFLTKHAFVTALGRSVVKPLTAAAKTVIKNPGKALTGTFVAMDGLDGARAGVRAASYGKDALSNMRAGLAPRGATF